jgi:phosphoribosyl-ATP pyrophosphohydrolase/phosphoribosyl-AMP cyclohydrolase
MEIGILDLTIDWNKNPLIPAIAQDANTGMVLMLAYVNAEALELSVSTGYAHYYSRSRQSLWKKGESSGHLQRIKSIRLDCDNDSLLYVVEQTGPACHTGEVSCFYKNVDLLGGATGFPLPNLPFL